MDTDETRPWHYLRTNEGTSVPKVVTVFACDCIAEPVPGRPLSERRTLRAWHARTWRTEGKRPHVHEGSGDNAAGFWYYLQSVKRSYTSHWIFAHGLKDYLTWLGFWQKLDRREILIHKPNDYRVNTGKRLFHMKPGWAGALVLNDPPTWIKCRWEKGVLNFCDVQNYVKADLVKFAQAVGAELPDDLDEDSDTAAICAGLAIETNVLAEWLKRLFRTWTNEDLGCWRPTGSGLAWNAYRHKFLEPRTILVHSNREALALERSALFGGRCIVGFVGEVKPPRQRREAKVAGKTPLDSASVRGPVWRFDINSAYASVMKHYDYPSKLLCVRGSITEAQLAAWVHQYCVIAAVRIDSPVKAYPVRKGKQVFWRTGKFWVVLTTGELLDALERGVIVAIGETALYERRKLFGPYVDWAYAKKQLPDTPANAVDRAFGKVLCVSLYGRMGQVRQGWQDLPGEDPHGAWGMWSHVPGKGLEPGLYRAVGCAVQEYFRAGETLDSCPAIAAHVTAYARLAADWWMDQLPEKSLLYHDTDSFHVTRAGFERITALPASVGLRLEQLKLEEVADSAHYFGQKHYRFGDAYTLGSMALARRLVAGERFEVHVAEPIDSLLSRPLDGSTQVVVESRTVEEMPVGRWIGPDGWTSPYTLRLESIASLRAQVRALAADEGSQGHTQAVQAAMQQAKLF